MSVVAEREPGPLRSRAPEQVRLERRVGTRGSASGVPGRHAGRSGNAGDARVRVLRDSRRSTVDGCSAHPRARRLPVVVAIVFAVAVGIVGLGVLGGAVSDLVSETAPVPERTGVVVLEHGETLWELARHYAPDSAAGAVVHRIQRLNDLEAPSVTAGTPLVVPIQHSARSGAG